MPRNKIPITILIYNPWYLIQPNHNIIFTFFSLLVYFSTELQKYDQQFDFDLTQPNMMSLFSDILPPGNSHSHHGEAKSLIPTTLQQVSTQLIVKDTCKCKKPMLSLFLQRGGLLTPVAQFSHFQRHGNSGVTAFFCPLMLLLFLPIVFSRS